MRAEYLYKKNNHSYLVMGREEGRRTDVADTNQYLIQYNGRGLLLDPGGVEIFSVVAAELSKHFDLSNVDAVFASRQDPDVISSLSLWVQTNPQLVVYVPEVWAPYVAHYGLKAENIKPISDSGGFITLGGHDLEVIPAHYLHSPGNQTLYDPQAKVMFSAAIGSAILPNDNDELFVTDFNEHVNYMEDFHRRFMASNKAKQRWIAEVRKRDVEVLAPQQGCIFKGDDINLFLNWFENLEVANW
jgi:flavorubredoxin